MASTITQQIHGYISITNTESAYHALRNQEHLRFIQNATFSCCDGVAAVLAGKMLGQNIPRLHGPDLMLKCCEFGVEKKWRHYFYGGKEGIPEILSQKLTDSFPGLITAGTYSPPFSPVTPEEDEQIINQINSASPDIVWVGLGLLKQEKWIAGHRKSLNVPWMIGVGAAFDFHAGTVKRAPLFYRNIGLEWLYRLICEPRMFKRNILSFLFLLDVIKHRLKRNIRKIT
jgi:N-acetylglucosaminyldiphosphoundecaprenol N-acetyl-beta-D-mannosaminyltransferase